MSTGMTFAASFLRLWRQLERDVEVGSVELEAIWDSRTTLPMDILSLPTWRSACFPSSRSPSRTGDEPAALSSELARQHIGELASARTRWAVRRFSRRGR